MIEKLLEQSCKILIKVFDRTLILDTILTEMKPLLIVASTKKEKLTTKGPKKS